MRKRKKITYTCLSLLLAGITALCIVRWKAWFEMPEEPIWEGDTLDYTFQYPTGDAGSTILVLGDIHSRLKTSDYDSLALRVPDADMIVQTGDWMERGQNYYYQSLLHEWLHSQLCGLPVITTPGNHEYNKGFLSHPLSPVWEHAFSHPNNGPVGTPGASYYVDLPQVRFIVIDTNPLIRLIHLTRTLTWVKNAIYTAGDRYTVVVMHHPVISIAKWRFNPLIYSTFRYGLTDADLVLAGHDHSYMRQAPFVIMNTSGEVKEQSTLVHPQVASTMPVYGVLSLDSVRMALRVYRMADGVQIDSLYVKHH